MASVRAPTSNEAPFREGPYYENDAVISESLDHMSDNNINYEHAKYYWFGKKYFECVLAQQVYETCQADSSPSFLDSQWEKLLRSYPYHEVLPEIRSKLHAPLGNGISIDDSYQALLTSIGTMLSQGTSSDRKNMLEMIRKSSNIDDERQAQSDTYIRNNLPTTRTRSSSDSMGSQSSDEEPEAPEINPGQYTLLLKELSDKEGGELKYSEPIRYENNLDLFQTTLRFRGKTFKGIGKKKQISKNRASEEAYKAIKRNH